MRKIIFTGPESSGKSTLTAAVSKHFNGKMVNEYARGYLENLKRNYEERDLLHIAKGQMFSENKAAKQADSFLFCDTDLLTIKIWSAVKYGRCDDWIEAQIQQCTERIYFLCVPEMPWEPDPLRENPNDRMVLYQLYVEELKRRGFLYYELFGSHQERLDKVIGVLS